MTTIRFDFQTTGNRARRLLWGAVWWLAYRPSPRVLHGWRRLLLRIFGANIENGAHAYPSARIWSPWNLPMGEGSCLGDYVQCYSVDRVILEPHATVSQYSYLCTASHDYRIDGMPLITAPIMIGRHAWVAADAFIGPGVTVGERAVVGARASVFRDVDPWAVVGGNPARVIRKYHLEGEES
ncbi:MAG: hypothetical protein MRJ68_09485 [Nitrospira sp.]|nr:hypothetical protein [Nitrospira sp.]